MEREGWGSSDKYKTSQAMSLLLDYQLKPPKFTFLVALWTAWSKPLVKSWLEFKIFMLPW